MDSSGSIGDDDYEIQKDFVKDLTRIFPIGPSASRAAVVTYNDYPTVRVNFGDFDNTASFVEAIESINQTRGQTRIDRALVKTSEMFESARGNVHKVLIVLTDGAQAPDPDSLPLEEASQLLRDQGVTVHALGVGREINVTQLRSIVESESDVVLVDSFVDLLRKSQSIAAKACLEIGNGKFSTFQSIVESSLRFHWFSFTKLCDLLKKCTTSLANYKQTKTGLSSLMIAFSCASIFDPSSDCFVSDCSAFLDYLLCFWLYETASSLKIT